MLATSNLSALTRNNIILTGTEGWTIVKGKKRAELENKSKIKHD